MKKFYLCKLCLIVFGALLAVHTSANELDVAADCFDKATNSVLSKPEINAVVPIRATCESEAAVVYLVKAIESKNKIQMNKAKAVCEGKSDIGKITDIYYSFSVPLPESKKTGVVAAVKIIDDLFGKPFFAVTYGCKAESDEHRISRLNGEMTRQLCISKAPKCILLSDWDIRESKRLTELKAKPFDMVVNKQLIRAHEIEKLTEVLETISNDQIVSKEADDLLSDELQVGKILDIMTTRITRSWQRPIAFSGGREVFLRMTLTSNGELADVRIVRSSGDSSFDNTGLAAVKRAAPFKEVAEVNNVTFEEKFRTLTIKFRPED